MGDFILGLVVGFMLGASLMILCSRFEVRPEYVDNAVSMCSRNDGLSKAFVGIDSMRVVCKNGMTLSVELK